MELSPRRMDKGYESTRFTGLEASQRNSGSLAQPLDCSGACSSHRGFCLMFMAEGHRTCGFGQKSRKKGQLT